MGRLSMAGIRQCVREDGVTYREACATKDCAPAQVAHRNRARARTDLRVSAHLYAKVKRWMQQELATRQSQTRMKIAIENMPGLPVAGRVLNRHWRNTIAEWSRVHDWLTLDTTHWATFGTDPLVAYQAAGAKVCHVHLSNFDGREHRLPQRGRLDLAAFLRQLAADSYAGTICLELHPDALAYQDAEACGRLLRESVVFCREHLGAA
jgi:sugar phosphate isomerase/epimerase